MDADFWVDIGSVLIALGALWFSVVAWLASREMQKKHLDLQTRFVAIEEGRDKTAKEAQSKAAVRAELVKEQREDGRGYQRKLAITNDGPGVAKRIHVEMDGLSLEDHKRVVVRKDLLASELAPKATVKYLVSAENPKPQFNEVKITWEDESGDTQEWKSQLTF